MKEKLDLLSRLPEPAIDRAARTLLDLRDSWEWATKEERKDLARIGVRTMRGMHFKSEIAQRTLSDLGRDACFHADHATA